MKKRKKAKRQKPVQKWFYYARAGNVAKMGPFHSYEEASQFIIGHDGTPVERACIWAVPVAE